MTRRTILRLGTAFAVLAGLTLWLWPRPRPNVLLITLDTTRADRLGCYGYALSRTPALDSLAEAGVLCERAYTVAPLTLPAHVSLFTGLYPAESGVRTNGRGRLDRAIPTLAKALEDKGYDTGAFIAAFVLNAKFGLDRGFAIYDDDFTSDEPAHDALHRQRHGAAVVDAALAWLARPRSSPAFCWVHLYDPHFPYLDHADQFGDEFAGRPYDAEIAYVDRQVARLLDFLKNRGLESQTLVVVAGDHGEGLGDHVEQRHGKTLYEDTMRVPLLFRFPGRLNPGRRVTSNMSLVDVSPTILDLLELSDPQFTAERSLKPVLLRESAPSTLCYGATDEPFLTLGCAPLQCLIDGNWKYIRSRRPELYDLAADPQERHDLAEVQVDQIRAMESRLAEFEARLEPRSEVAAQLSSAERRALESLGYTGHAAGAAAGTAPSDLPDIKDMLPFDVAVDEAQELIDAGALDQAAARLKEIVRESPGNIQAYWRLAGVLQAKSEFAEAESVFRALLSRQPESREGRYGLGLLLMSENRLEAAIPEFQKILENDPEFAEAEYNLGKALVTMGRGDDGLAHLSRAIEIDPQYGEAYHWRANLRVHLGQTEQALDDYQLALKYDPDSPDAHHNLGRVLAALGQGDDAQRHLVRAIELSPAVAELHYGYGVFLVQQRRYDEALSQFEEALKFKPDYVAAQQQMRAARDVLRAKRNQSN